MMDNVAHTLFGLALAKAGLERRTPLATAALVISSNLPDIDVFSRLNGDAIDYLQHHRGFTHSFVGLTLLAGLLTLGLWCFQKLPWYDLKRRGSVRPLRLFGLCLLGGLGHSFFDYTNNYGIRPFLPFSDRWVYGDLIFVVDPWIWLILGASAVWLTSTTKSRTTLWLLLGFLTSLLIVFVRQSAAQPGFVVPAAIRVGWFIGIAVISAGHLLNWRRQGAMLARGSLVLLMAYYVGMVATRAQVISIAASAAHGVAVAWPAPANPLVWQAVVTSQNTTETGWVKLVGGSPPVWSEVQQLDPDLLQALRQNDRCREFLKFARYCDARVLRDDEGCTVEIRDLRFTLRMTARIDSEGHVANVTAQWY